MGDVENKELRLDDSQKVDKLGNPILGKLRGICADCFAPTRNNRLYNEELWKKVFKDPIIKEYFDAGGILGELDHPKDRLETDTSKIAVCMHEPPIEDKNGKLTATFDILDTPNGRIVYTLAKYGYKLGVSSRGDGEIEDCYDENNTESVIPDSFRLEGFDIVLLPAVKEARLQMVESVKKTFNQALTEAFERSNADEKQIMKKTLSDLKIDYNSEKNDNNKIVGKLEESKKPVDNAQDSILMNLQEALKQKLELEKQVRELKEQISVCNAKELANENSIAKYKVSIRALSEAARLVDPLKTKVKVLSEQLSTKDLSIKKAAAELQSAKKIIESLPDKRKIITESMDQLKKTTVEKDKRIQELSESLSAQKKANDNSVKLLKESVDQLKKDAVIKKNSYEQKLTIANRLVEKYNAVAKESISRYIDFKAKNIGIDAKEITNKLDTKHISFNAIDTICENLQDYKVNMSKLPFIINQGKKVRMKVTESVEPINANSGYDDEIDDSLLSMTNLK